MNYGRHGRFIDLIPPGIFQVIEHTWKGTRFWMNSIRMKQVLKPVNMEYEQYLKRQLRRTLKRRRFDLPLRAKHLIDKTVEFIVPDQTYVLCVGCRNGAELDYFRAKGIQAALGIDLQSTRSDILIMDMHAMTFASNSFDLVYSSHSLEHAHYPEQAVLEFIRICKAEGLIAIEVPVNYDQTNPTADLHDFKTVDNLLRLFGQHVSRVLWKETDLSLDAGNDVIRIIIKVKK